MLLYLILLLSGNIYILHKIKRFMLYKLHLYFIKNFRIREFLFRINKKKRIIATCVALEWRDWQERSDLSQILYKFNHNVPKNSLNL